MKKMDFNIRSVARFAITLFTLLKCSILVFADREPSSKRLLIYNSDLVAYGEVERIEMLPEGKLSSAVAHVRIIEKPLKGNLESSQLSFLFGKSEMGESINPLQFKKGESYLFFLSKTLERFRLTNPYDGAIRSKELSQNLRAEIDALVNEVSVFSRQMEGVVLDLKIQEETILTGDSPNITLTITNNGAQDLGIPMQIVGDNQELNMCGWTNLLLETLIRGKVADSINLGGRSIDEKRQINIKGGESIDWQTKFSWHQFGKKPGTYQLTWKVGKIKSNTVQYQVVDRDTEISSQNTQHVKRGSYATELKDNKSSDSSSTMVKKAFKLEPMHYLLLLLSLLAILIIIRYIKTPQK